MVFCEDGDQIVLADDGVERQGSIGGDHLYVDGMVGDLGNTVLSERRTLGDDKFVTVVVHVDMGTVDRRRPRCDLSWLGVPALAEPRLRLPMRSSQPVGRPERSRQRH